MRQACTTTVFCLALLVACAVRADVLVTIDGSVVETKGPWEQRGKMVVFTLGNGQLSALRAEDVDFEATERWRAEIEASASAQTPTPAEPARARIVLTDADVAHGNPVVEAVASDSEPAAAEAPGATANASADPATQSPVRVTAWDQDEPADGRGRRVSGTLRNDGNTYATDITMRVTVYDNDGAFAGTEDAAPIKTSLRPGESTTFSIQFTEAYVIGATRFQIDSVDLELDSGEDAPGAEL